MKAVRILHIDDDADDSFFLFDAIRKIVENPIYHFCTSANEAKALLLLGNFQPDVIFVDYQMPITNGIDFLLWLKSNALFEKIPVVVLATSERSEVMQHALAAGASFFFLKPTDLTAWSEIVLKPIKQLSDNQSVKDAM
jgi:CheY-like chemotaxis protein